LQFCVPGAAGWNIIQLPQETDTGKGASRGEKTMAGPQDAGDTVAIIGAGEMGSAIGRRLREMGAPVITEVRGRSAESVERVRRAGLKVIEDDNELVSEATFILSIVPPGVAVEVAERFRGPISRAPIKPVFVECNAIAPITVRRIAETLAPTRCKFVDAGIIGGPPPAGVGSADKGPRIYASGADAHLVAALSRYGLDIAVMDGPIGAASELKLSYAGVTKGLTALAAAVITGASRNGLADALHAELARSQPDMLKRFERFVPGMLLKAYRWVAEMEEIAKFLGEQNDGGMMYTGAARLYERVAAEFDGTPGDRVASLTAFCKPPK
jgi:putative dehydrogenase